MPLIKGFLLTRQYCDTKNGIQLIFWLNTDFGAKKIVINNQHAVMFIKQEDLARTKKRLSTHPDINYKNLNLKTFMQQPVAALYFNSQYSFYAARDKLLSTSIDTFETDIRPTERYLSERFITAEIQVNCIDNKPYNNPQLKPTCFKPKLTALSIDIETDFQNNQLYSISLYNTDHSITLMLKSSDRVQSTDKISFFDTEKSLLQCFLNWMNIIDADIIIGWNVVNFDFRFLQTKFDECKIAFNIGRENSLVTWRKARTETQHYFLFIPGRIVLDGIDTLKSATYTFESFSLDAVSQQLLKRKKLIQSDNNHDPLYKAKEIQRLFKHDKIALAAYNLEDSKLVWDIFEHADLINFAIERAKLTGLEMDRVGGSVAAFDNLYLPRLHRKGYIAPNIGDFKDDISAPGGYVMDSKPGLHQSVLVLDYKSLYPSIILSFHIDPYARIAAKKQSIKETIPGFNGASFSKTEFILPDIIKQLWSARDKAKRDNNKALSQAIKIIMNSFYGVLGTPGCRIHDSRLTSSITLRGHEIMQTTARLIEQQGYNVIYGDTDSVFVSLEQLADKPTADKIGNTLIKHINKYWHTELKQKYNIKSYLEMEYETHYKRFFMPTIRGSKKGSKKRYAGLQNIQGTDTLIFKGLESVRSDWTLLARQFQKDLYERIFFDKPYEEFILATVSELQQGRLDNKLIYRKRLRQKLSDYTKNTPPHARAAIKAEYFFKQNAQTSRYQRPGWIEYVITLNGPETLECQSSRIDYQHYIDKQLAPVADAILSLMNTSLENICQQQYSLFH